MKRFLVSFGVIVSAIALAADFGVDGVQVKSSKVCLNGTAANPGTACISSDTSNNVTIGGASIIEPAISNGNRYFAGSVTVDGGVSVVNGTSTDTLTVATNVVKPKSTSCTINGGSCTATVPSGAGCVCQGQSSTLLTTTPLVCSVSSTTATCTNASAGADGGVVTVLTE